MNRLYRRAYVGGTFDCLHHGHLALLAAVRGIALETVVSLNTDEFAARYKRHPFIPLADRMAAIAACRFVDQVMVNEGDEDSKISIVAANVDCIVHGDDWPIDSLMVQMGLSEEWLKANGITMVTLNYTKDVNTSALFAAYEQRKLGVSRTIPDPNITTCSGCNRAVLWEHLNADGNCGCIDAGHGVGAN